MKFRSVMPFALALLGIGALFFQTSCKPSRNLEASHVLAQEAASIMKKLKKKESFLYESVIGQAISLSEAKSKNPDITVTAELDSSNNTWAAWDNKTSVFTLAQRPDGSAGKEEVTHKIKFSFKHKNAHKIIPGELEVKIPSAQKLVEYASNKLKNPSTETSKVICQEDQETSIQENLVLPSFEGAFKNSALENALALDWNLNESASLKFNTEKTLLEVKPDNRVEIKQELKLTVTLNEGFGLASTQKPKLWTLKVLPVQSPEYVANIKAVNKAKILFGFEGKQEALVSGQKLEFYGRDFQEGKALRHTLESEEGVNISWALARIEDEDNSTPLVVSDNLQKLYHGKLDAGTYSLIATLFKDMTNDNYYERTISFTITLQAGERPAPENDTDNETSDHASGSEESESGEEGDEDSEEDSHAADDSDGDDEESVDGSDVGADDDADDSEGEGEASEEDIS